MARNPLASYPPVEPLNPLASDAQWPDQQEVTQGDAWKHTLATIDDWLAQQRADAKARGLWDDETGFPTRAGMLDGVHQYAQAMMMGTSPLKGIRAFHGSPYQFPPTSRSPLGEFSDAHIGAGEGNQAYLYGHYFAGHEATGKTYKTAGGPPDYLADGKPYDINNPDHFAALTLSGYPSRRAAIDDLKASANFYRSRNDETGAMDFEQTAARIKQGKLPKIEEVPSGHMYEVNLNVEPEHLLDWDKPMHAQSAHVLDAMKKAGATDSVLSSQDPAGALMRRALANPYHASDVFNGGGEPLPLTNQELSRRLNEAGVPGVRYLDQESRSAGDGTSNYVMFDPGLVQILRRYGLIGTLGAASPKDGGQ